MVPPKDYDSYIVTHKMTLFKALRLIEDKSCIRFRDQSQVQHEDFIEFFYGKGCYSNIGRAVKGKQRLSLGGCTYIGIHLVVHEVSFFNLTFG